MGLQRVGYDLATRQEVVIASTIILTINRCAEGLHEMARENLSLGDIINVVTKDVPDFIFPHKKGS